MTNSKKYNESTESLIDRVTPMLDEVDLETYVDMSIDMDDPQGLNKNNQPERARRLDALFDQQKITVQEFRRLVVWARQ